MSQYVKRCLVVPAGWVELARSLSEGLAGPAGAGMFLFPLSPSGQEPATAYLTEGHIEPQFAALMEDPALLHAACQAADPPVDLPLSQCAALLSACDVSEDNPFAAMARMGLKPVLQDEIQGA